MFREETDRSNDCGSIESNYQHNDPAEAQAGSARISVESEVGEFADRCHRLRDHQGPRFRADAELDGPREEFGSWDS